MKTHPIAPGRARRVLGLRRWLSLAVVALALAVAWAGFVALAASRASLHYSMPIESINAAGGVQASVHSTGLSSIGVPGGEQSSTHYWARLAPVSPLSGDGSPDGPLPLVTGNGVYVIPGDASLSATNGTDYGRRRLLGAPTVHTFTLRNAGAEPFEFTGIGTMGADAADFLPGGLTLPIALAPGGAIDFSVAFRPQTPGLRSANIRLTIATAGVPAYEFAVRGLCQGEIFVMNTNDSGPGSLREAINTANTRAGEDVILFALGVTGTIELQSPLPEITESLALEGPGPARLTISRGLPSTPYSLLSVAPGFNGALSIKGLLLRDGAGRAGVVALSGGSLAVEDCTFLANRVSEDLGSGALLVSDGATLTANRCAFLYNDK